MTMPPAMGYDPYTLLRTLIERVAWPTEADKNAALESVNQYESIGMFGNLAKQMACKHPPERIQVMNRGTSGKCMDCGREVGPPAAYGYRGPQAIGGGY